ncbi:response regulator transcription factor [Paenimyroides aestuarii]|uniref:Response regulator transcription factor n=1 Tax=Paenimyroides aestuarii TaxID=2968490 RepID=A0ABY5NUU8_9FLAO|nr:response regulator transcription factor [Paenimyroides aestuarii]UUV22331.1 response regulator transcription factor [Paenimyroides aestuarii]
MLKIAITDDHTLFRKSLAMLINSFEGMQVVFDAANGIELLDTIKNHEVDILLLDLQMPKMDGFETCKILKAQYPSIKIMILSHLNHETAIERVLDLGIAGYFTKNISSLELEDALWDLTHDGFYFENNLRLVINKLLAHDRKQKPNHTDQLFSDREIEIIKWTAEGLKAKEIADRLYISPKTVNSHKQNIQNKYSFDSMMSAILYCIKNKIITINTL